PLKIPANAARRPSDLGASENVHLATIFVLDFRCFSVTGKMSDHFCYLRWKGAYIHGVLRGCCLGGKRHPHTYVGRRRFQHGPLKQIWYLIHVTHAHGVHAHEMHAHEMHTNEMYTNETYTCEMYAYELHAHV